jgi:hypothetical protein
MDSLKIENYIQQLQEQHDKMDKEIQMVESTHRNQMMIVDLKKKKLKLKDEIQNLKKQSV